MNLRAIIVCVDYADILAITLPYNLHHFKEVMVVTHGRDHETAKVVRQHGKAGLFFTEAFYDNGAVFNKWKALEQGLDAFGRSGLMCIMDADVLWPKVIDHDYLPDHLYTPRRRVQFDVRASILPEEAWHCLPLFNEGEFAGYSQIFYGNDGVLPAPPWHQIDWIHAGGADSEFQYLWPPERKIRPPWEVLHLGHPGTNWFGRATTRTDGSLPAEAKARTAQLRQMLALRQATRSYSHERLAGQ